MKAVFTDKAIAQLREIEANGIRKGVKAEILQLLNAVEDMAANPDLLKKAHAVPLENQLFDKVYLVGKGNVRAVVANDSGESLVVANVYENHQQPVTVKRFGRMSNNYTKFKFLDVHVVSPTTEKKHPLRHSHFSEVRNTAADNHTSSDHHRKG